MMKQYEKSYINALNGEYGLDTVKELIRFRSNEKGFRMAGTAAEKQAAEWIAREMKEIGLQEVEIETFPVDGWTFLGGKGTITTGTAPYEFELCSFPGLPAAEGEGICGKVIYVGEGKKADYEGKDVRGNIVLIDTRIFEGNWYSTIYKQAELMGVKAILAAPTAPNPGSYSDDLITVQEVETKIGIPAFSISMKTGKEIRRRLKSREQVGVTIRADAKLDRNAEAHFISGKIPGKNRNKYIVLCGHYDAYWEGVMDNATSLGSELCIARAMIESGYEPEYTIVFSINGAEEFGHADTLYAWMVGAQAMTKAHPEWVENSVLFYNIETSALCQDKRLGFAISPVYRKAVEDICEELRDMTEGYYESYYTADVGMGSDDYIFSCAGTPAMLHKAVDVYSDFSNDGFLAYYHTTEDNLGKFNMEYFNINNAIFGLALMKFDHYHCPPMDFTEEMEQFWADLDPNVVRVSCTGADQVKALTDSLSEKAKTLYCAISDINKGTFQLSAEEKDAVVGHLLKVNRVIRRDIYKIDTFLMENFGHKIIYDRLTALDEFVNAVERGKVREGLETFLTKGYNRLIIDFDEDVYRTVALEPFREETKKYWAEGKVFENQDYHKVCSMIREKMNRKEVDYSEELDMLHTCLEKERSLLSAVFEEEKFLLSEVEQQMNACLKILTKQD